MSADVDLDNFAPVRITRVVSSMRLQRFRVLGCFVWNLLVRIRTFQLRDATSWHLAKRVIRQVFNPLKSVEKTEVGRKMEFPMATPNIRRLKIGAAMVGLAGFVMGSNSLVSGAPSAQAPADDFEIRMLRYLFIPG